MSALALSGIERWDLRRGTRSKLERLFGVGDAPGVDIASDMALRSVVGNVLIDRLLELHRRNPGVRLYSATFIDDRIRTRDKDTLIDVERFHKTVRDILRDHGIGDWIGVVEFQPYTNWKKGRGREIAPHMHVLFWTCTKLSRRELEKKLQASKRFVSFSSAPTVKVRRRYGEGAFAQAAAYLLKSCERGKNSFVSTRKAGKLVHLDAACRSDLGVRMMEILSQLRLSELILSSGEGKAMRASMMQALRAFIYRRTTRSGCRSIAVDDVAAIWRSARRQAGKNSYSPVEIIRKGPRL